MRFRTKLFAWAIVMSLVLMIGFSTIPQAKANPRFTIADWEHPDEYGQGIYNIRPQENSSGAWVNFVVPPWVYSNNASNIEVNASTSIKLLVAILVNYTLLGLSDPADFALGLNSVRLNVTVTNSSSITIFSQNNFTYIEGAKIETGIWYYSQYVILNFVTEHGQIYTATVTYEVFW